MQAEGDARHPVHSSRPDPRGPENNADLLRRVRFSDPPQRPDRPARHRHKGLASFRVTLHHGNNKGKYARLAAENRHDGLAVLPNMKFCKIVIALGVTRIDREVFYRIACLDNIAKWSKGLTVSNSHFNSIMNGSYFPSRPNKRSRETPPSGKILNRTWEILPSFATSFSKLCTASICSFWRGKSSCQNIDWVVID